MTTALQSIGLSELERVMGTDRLASPQPVRDRWGRFKRDPGGQWDWFYALEPSERSYIQRNYMGGRLGPDDVATWLGTDIDSAMEMLVESIRLARSKIRDSFDEDYDPSSYDDDVTQLVGPDEIAAMLHVGRNTIAQWRHRRLLPPPVITLSSLPIWDRREIVEWAKETNRESVTLD